MKPDYIVLRELQQALLDAFPSKASLAGMVRYGLGMNLDAIAGGDNLTEIIDRLINWARANGKLVALVTAARKDNPGNVRLRGISIAEISRLERSGTQNVKDEGNAQLSADAEMYLQRGNVRYEVNDYDGAIKEYNRAIKRNPELAEAYMNRGSAYYSIAAEYEYYGIEPEADEGYAHALADYTQAIRIRPTADVYCKRASVYEHFKYYEHAIEDYEQAIAKSPNDSYIYYRLGVIYYIIRDYNQAINKLTQSIQINPYFVYSYYERAKSYKQKGEESKSEADYKRVLELADNSKLRQAAQQALSPPTSDERNSISRTSDRLSRRKLESRHTIENHHNGLKKFLYWLLPGLPRKRK